MGMQQVVFGCLWKSIQQKGFDRAVPGGVDNRLMGQYGIGMQSVSEGQQEKNGEACPAPRDAGQVGEELQFPSAVDLRMYE